MRIDPALYQRTLGDELRKARKQLGWTRKDLQQRLDREVSLQTLATYELGTRQCSVVRLAELCHALHQQPYEVLRRVHERLFATGAAGDGSSGGRISLDLAAAAVTDLPELRPLRRWAASTLRARGNAAVGAGEPLALDAAALERLADLCGLELLDLIRRLRTLTRLSPCSSS